MPRKDVAASYTYDNFLTSARDHHVFEGSYENTLQQINEAQAHYFDAWVWKGCRDSKRLAEFYERLDERVRRNRDDWDELLHKFDNDLSEKKGNYVVANKEMVEALKRIAEKKELVKGDSSVNTKSISGDTNDDAASLTSESIHKRLDHSDK